MAWKRDAVLSDRRARTRGHAALRSAGPLSSAQRWACRDAGIELLYDPVQIGWVRADAIDDFDDPSADADALLAAMRGRFERLAAAESSAFVALERTPAEFESRLWKLAERVVREYQTHGDATRMLQSAALHELQAVAAGRIGGRAGRTADRREWLARRDALSRQYRLRPWRTEEGGRYLELLDDAQVWEHLPDEPPAHFDEGTARALIELSNTAPHHEVRAIEIDEEPVGQVRLEFGRGGRPPGDFREAEISYWLGRDYWGRGIASDVVWMYTGSCFEQRRLDSIFARVREENAASSGVLEKSGYRFEGRLRAELDGEPGMRTHRAFRCQFTRPRDANARPSAGWHGAPPP